MNKVDIKRGYAQAETFAEIYPIINCDIMDYAPEQSSRGGDTKEVLNFKTHITNPYRRCVGGQGRDINIFFLLAEAMWIAVGRKDVKFLTMFNKRMADFSDDGVVFHAPYGYRLRHCGNLSESCSYNTPYPLPQDEGVDQVKQVLRVLQDNPDSRQAVMSIWNSFFDLNVKSRDIPCNDMVMLKIRDNKLITTIQNRSNDLHWGLPTNVFQFSFLTEVMANCLGVTLGTQTHNSQSLHIYGWNGIATTMQNNHNKDQKTLYDYAVETPMDFNFFFSDAVKRMEEFDTCVNTLLKRIEQFEYDGRVDSHFEEKLKRFSSYLFVVYKLLMTYVEYKKNIAHTLQNKTKHRIMALESIEAISLCGIASIHSLDIIVLAKNFFTSKMTTREKSELHGELFGML